MKSKAVRAQQSRWEHGQLEMMTKEVPRLIREAILQRRLDLLVLALEVAAIQDNVVNSHKALEDPA